MKIIPKSIQLKPRFALISILQYEMKVSWAKNDDIMRLIQSFSDSESKSFQRFGVRKQPSVSRGSGLKLQNPAVQLISKPRDVYNSTYNYEPY